MSTVLITGGSGLIGDRLSDLLSKKGYVVIHLSRTANYKSKYKTYTWNLSDNYIDPLAFKNVEHIIHLAGTSVAEGRWTESKKESILNSRVNSTTLLFKSLKGQTIRTYISASGISYYGAKTVDHIFRETDTPANDYLANVTVQWEKSAEQFKGIADRVVCLRTPFVLSSKGGGLIKMAQPIKMGVGSPLGFGNQYMPWVHIDDMCHIYIQAIENSSMTGIYNASAGEHITNSKLTAAIAKQLGKKIWAPNVPNFVLRLILGEMSDIILNGSRISNQKLLDTGFKFQFPSITEALKDCLNKKSL
jgi:uncharacterized protein (TIGR01777 family)